MPSRPSSAGVGWFVALLCAVWMAGGCDAVTYGPSGEPFTEVDPTPGVLHVSVPEAADTLGLWGVVWLNFGAVFDRAGTLDEVDVLIDGAEVDASFSNYNRDRIAVRFDTTPLSDGLHSLTVRARASSGTGSLAEVYGGERGLVRAEVTRTILVDNAPPSAVEVRVPGNEGGVMMVRWDRYERPNFHEYRVCKVDSDGRREYCASVAERDSTTWRDLRFLGGTARYTVAVVDKNGRSEAYSTDGGAFTVPELVVAEGSSRGQFRLAWTGTPFTAVLNHYEIEHWNETFHNKAVVVSTRDTTASVTLENDFGSTHRFRLVVRGRTVDIEGDIVEVVADPASGLTGPVAPASGGGVFGAEGDRGPLVLFDPVRHTVLTRAPFPLSGRVDALVSSPGGRLGVVYGDRYAALLDPETLAFQSPRISLSSSPRTPELTDAGVLFYGGTFATYSGDGFTVTGVDLVENRVVSQMRFDGGASAMLAVSADGRFLVLNGSRGGIFERDATEASGYRRRADGGENILDAAVAGPSRLAVLRATSAGSQVQILDLPTLTQVAAIPVPPAAARALHYDPDSNRLAYVMDSESAGSTVHVFVPEEGASITSIRSAFRYDEIRVVASTLWGPGRYRHLD